MKKLGIYLFFTFLLFSNISLAQQETLIKRINCGGSSVTADDGLDYDADISSDDISFTSNSTTIDFDYVGPELNEPYRSFRLMSRNTASEFDYTFSNLQNGEYKVVLHFAEPYHGVANSNWNTRRFDIDVNSGEFTVDNFNIMTAAALPSSDPMDGAKKIYKMVADSLTVANGSLVIKFTQVANDPIVNAIELFKLENIDSGTTSNWTKSGSNIFYTLGNVGIGTGAITGYRLAVDGPVRAREVRVDTDNWPDYVFQKEYTLPTLDEVEKHIEEKGHLPNIPSANDVETNGIEVGEMNRLLLEKVEELTLYILNQDKQLKLQKQISVNQYDEFRKLEKRVLALEASLH
ncbi:hypothetical protein B4Q04_20245 [Zobellia sp. OII3]|uniref:malectin domain-containing carbohydrate-binding protein n=1 Tax=Zobellia sp. OII3 TaxID=2034520 RepID=UPI000B52C0DC|nr:malectin domain-containing carbohydrate-binding protein [Zobellia sp. OII3]OWW23530.1 hypothetical protein B4Q04_20245 [Zobellia sp. OII3]